MQISFRPVHTQDFDFLWKLHVLSFKAYVEEIWGWDETQQIEMFKTRFDPQHSQIIQADGQDVGRLDIEYQTDEIFLSLIAILPDYQGQGIGTSIIQSLIEKAYAQAKLLTLRVLRPNPAQYLYKRLGFEVVKEDEVRFWMVYDPAKHHKS